MHDFRFASLAASTLTIKLSPCVQILIQPASQSLAAITAVSKGPGLELSKDEVFLSDLCTR
ncbi:exported hypothetical protein [Verrucomicrobia bacterium]|nr:exported hypothetical protein [Verrucomicrobiota bacterium]